VMKILLAIDGSACSDLAVDEVARRPWPAGSIVRVIYVIEPLTVAVPEAMVPSDCYFDAIERAAHDALQRGTSKIENEASSHLKVEQMVCTGYPKQIIVDEAEGWRADLIVVGSHGRGWAGRLLLGSVSQAVALHAKCSVEIVRCRKSGSHHDEGETDA